MTDTTTPAGLDLTAEPKLATVYVELFAQARDKFLPNMTGADKEAPLLHFLGEYLRLADRLTPSVETREAVARKLAELSGHDPDKIIVPGICGDPIHVQCWEHFADDADAILSVLPAPEAEIARAADRLSQDGDTRERVQENLCDCELSHNGLGITGRICDCPAGAALAEAEERGRASKRLTCLRIAEAYIGGEYEAQGRAAEEIAYEIGNPQDRPALPLPEAGIERARAIEEAADVARRMKIAVTASRDRAIDEDPEVEKGSFDLAIQTASSIAVWIGRLSSEPTTAAGTKGEPATLDVEAAVAAEREECAKIADEYRADSENFIKSAATWIAEDIRARTPNGEG